jgi:hypothetical protein
VPRITKQAQLTAYVRQRGWTRIGESEWRELRAALPDISETTIRDSGLEIDAPWCGVRQHTLDDLQRSLDDFTAVYQSRPDLHSYCRALVIEAKDHARFASRSPRVDEAKRVLKAEMLEWMLVWLGDPGVFPAWSELRRARLGAG